MLDVIIKAAADLTEEERRQVDETSALAYAGDDAEDKGWSDSQWMVLGKLNGQVVSLAGLLVREVKVGQQVVKVGGVGGVATHPRFQNRGFAAQVLRRAAEYLRDVLGASFGLLVCSPMRVSYYARAGWQPMTAELFFEQLGARRRFEGPAMVLRLSDATWPDGVVDLCGGPW